MQQKNGYDLCADTHSVQSSCNVMENGDAREGKWRGSWWMEWVASTLHTTSEHGVSSITTADAHTSAARSRLNWPHPPPADINELVRFAERRNLVSARVPSHFKRSLLHSVPFDSFPLHSPLRLTTLHKYLFSSLLPSSYFPWKLADPN